MCHSIVDTHGLHYLEVSQLLTVLNCIEDVYLVMLCRNPRHSHG